MGKGAVLVAALALTAALGCAFRGELPRVSPAHPACPRAETPPLPEPSGVLDVSEPVRAPEPMPEMVDHGSMHDNTMHHQRGMSE